MRALKVNMMVITAIVLWASAFVGIRIGLASYSPGALALLRFLVASLFMGIIYWAQKTPQKVRWQDRILLLLAGMGGIGIYNICLNFGELSVSAGVASFIIGLMPIMTMILSVIFLRERLKKGTWTGITVSVLGLSLIALSEQTSPGSQQGIIAILLSAIMGAILTIVQKQYAQKYHPIAIIFWVMCGGTLFLTMFFPKLILELQQAERITTWAVVYMGIFPAAIAYLAWSYALKHLTASAVSVSLYALPLVSTFLGYLMLNEQPSQISLMGSLITLFGAYLANRYQHLEGRNIEESSAEEINFLGKASGEGL